MNRRTIAKCDTLWGESASEASWWGVSDLQSGQCTLCVVIADHQMAGTRLGATRSLSPLVASVCAL